MAFKSIFDASALMALAKRERGWEMVNEYEAGSALGAVNLSEAAAKFELQGLSGPALFEFVWQSGLTVLDFNADLSVRAANLVLATRSLGLSFGDRACLALAQRENVPVLTSDTAWRGLDVGVEIRFIR